MARQALMLTKALHGFTHHTPIARFDLDTARQPSLNHSTLRRDAAISNLDLEMIVIYGMAVYSGPTRSQLDEVRWYSLRGFARIQIQLGG